MKINQISRGSSVSPEQLRNLAVSEFVNSCPLAPFLEFYSTKGNADSPRKTDGAMTAGDTRAIGDDYTAKSNTPGFGAVALKIYGDKVKTDIAYERRGIDIGSQRALDLANFSKSLGRYFMDALINHTIVGAPEHIDGLKAQATTLSRVSKLADNGASVPNGNSSTNVGLQHTFLEWLDAQINDIVGGPDCLVMNGSMKARLKSIGRNNWSVQSIPDVYGANQNVDTYNGIPIVNAGYAANNTGLIIPNNETCGNTSTSTSIYLLKFGEQTDVTLATNIGLDVQDMGLVGTEYLTLVEFDVDLAILNSYAFKRCAGIILG